MQPGLPYQQQRNEEEDELGDLEELLAEDGDQDGDLVGEKLLSLTLGENESNHLREEEEEEGVSFLHLNISLD